MTSLFAAHAPGYWAKGLSVIPLQTASKQPSLGLKNWTGYCDNLPKQDTRNDWLHKYRDEGIGLCLGTRIGSEFRIAGIDVDFELFTRVAESVVGPCPSAKRGRKGVTLFVRVPIRSQVKSTTLKRYDKLSAIDVLVGGRMTVLPPSIHPETGRAYEWRGSPLIDVEFEQIPTFDDEKSRILRLVVGSEHALALTTGETTHDSGLRLGASLVAAGLGDEAIIKIIQALLPNDYQGDTLDQLPGMIADAREKGFAKPAPKSAEFEMTESGLIFNKPIGKSFIPINVCDPFEILGQVRDTKSAGWARLLRWRDADGCEHEFIASNKQLLSDHDVVCGEMAEQGLRISKGQQSNLARYILASKAEGRLTLVYRIGWHKMGEKDVFVLPSQVIGEPPSRVIYNANDKRQDEYSVRGTVSDWRHEVSIPAGQHALAALAISASLAGPLLHLAGLESGGIHLFGNSSTGKTTLQKLAASVWADGGLVQSWRATSNGLEGIANRTSDVVLILDELGQLDTRETATSLYMLASGVGKIRMNRNATLQDIKTWRAFVLSSGEMTVEAKITQLRGAKAYTGATLRLLNVAADRGLGFGVFDSPGPTDDARDLVNTFSTAAASAYGLAGPEFVRELISRAVEGEAIRNAIDHFVRSNVEHGASGQVERAAKRFGLIAAAGELATEFGVTGWLPGTAAAAAAAAFKKWVEVRGGDGKEPAEDRAAIRQVTELIVRYGESRFDELDERGFKLDPPWTGESGSSPPPPRPSLIRLGWRKNDGEKRIWMIEDAVWESEFCKGFDPVQVSKALARHGMLKCAKDRFTYAERFEDKRNKRFHVLTAKVLTSDYDSTAEDAPDDDDGVPERPKRPDY